MERRLYRVMQEGRRVDEFLIITFTRAAAEELRSRIAGELNQAVRANPDNAHLRRQTVLLYQTQISTIHAFCTVLLRQFGHLLDVPTDFTLCEDEESQVLMARTLEEVLEARYVDIDPLGEFAQLLDVLSAGRDDSRLAEITLDVFAKIQSYPDPLAWLAEQREALELTGVADAGQTPWGRLLLEEARGSAAYWGERIAYACDLAQGDPALEKGRGRGGMPLPSWTSDFPAWAVPGMWRTRGPRWRSRTSGTAARRKRRSSKRTLKAPAPPFWRTWCG